VIRLSGAEFDAPDSPQIAFDGAGRYNTRPANRHILGESVNQRKQPAPLKGE
jgi:hypothetical protein